MPSNILFLQKRANKAGAQVCLSAMLRALTASHIHCAVFTGECGWLTEQLERDAIAFNQLNFPSLRSPLSRLIKSGDFTKAADAVCETSGPFHIIHANDIWDALIAEMLAKRWNVPWIVHLRSVVPMERFYAYHCDKATAVIVVSPALEARVRGWRRNKLVYIPDGIFRECLYDVSKSALSRPQTIAVLGHGGVQKGWNDAASAFALIGRRGGAMPRKVVFIGYVEPLREKEILSIMPKEIAVEFTGFVPNLSEALTLCDAAIMPSRQESLGMVVIEALAAGIPVIASRTGIVPELMKGYETWTFEPGNSGDCAEAYDRVVHSWHNRDAFLEHCRGIIRADFVVEQTVRKQIELYSQIM